MLQVSLRSKVGVVVMINQASEGKYNYKMIPLVFGEYETSNTNMPDIAEMEGIYLGTRTISKGILKFYQIMSLLPLFKTDENTLSVPFSPIKATQIAPKTYIFDYGDMAMTMQASTDDTRTMMSMQFADYVKTSWGKVIFWITTLILFTIAGIYGLISLICTLIRLIRHKNLQLFGKFRVANDTSILLSLANLVILITSMTSMTSISATHTSVLIQGILFIILGLIPVAFTGRWIWVISTQKQKIDK